MITVKLLGGLCNQMFQAAYAWALKDRGYEIQFDKSDLIEGTHREYSLGYFGIGAVQSSQSPHIYENGMRFNLSNLQPPDPSTMIGYWQSEKYFEQIADKIKYQFRFSNHPTYPRREAIALHVRRRDYVGLEQFHGLPSVGYYREAVAHIRREVGMLVPVVVVSDDRQWCHENFSDFTIFEGENKYEDLKLMASCDYAVIANSSFSWWGAWLGPQKLVVAPKRWFSDPSMDYSDIVPDRWVKM